MKLGFIGAGNMAGAIISGVLGAEQIPPHEIGVYDINEEKCAALGKQGLQACQSPFQLVERCKYVVLAIKPQNFEEVLGQIAGAVTEETVIISIAAGISPAYIKAKLGESCKVVQVMPNTPLLIGYGATAISKAEPTTQEEFDFAYQLFASAGMVEKIDNCLMNEVIPLNGSSPAFIYLLAKLFVDRAQELGFDRDCANRLFCNTLIGSAQMMLTTGLNHQALIDMVTSPAGTTFSGLQALADNGFHEAIRKAYDATVKRAYELGK